MKRLAVLVMGFVALGAECEVDQPCQDYVDYVCTCHADDPDFDCQELRTAFADAGQALQDQCAIDLDTLQEEDEADGLECVAR